MSNPFNIPEEFVFTAKTSDQVLKLYAEHLENDFVELRQIVDKYEPDASTNRNFPLSFRNTKHEILSQTCILNKLFEFARDKIYMTWNIPGELEISDYGFFLYKEGSSFGRHSDNGGFEFGKSVIKQPNRKFTVLTYMDDYGVDYEGGELVFPDLIPPVVIMPKKCEMVIMPSNIYFMHEVKKVTKGKRIIFTFFLDVKDKP